MEMNYPGCGHEINIFVKETQENIIIPGYEGTWTVIASRYYKHQFGYVFLLESDKYKDDAFYIAVNSKYEILAENVEDFADFSEIVNYKQITEDFFQVTNERLISREPKCVLFKFIFESTTHECITYESSGFVDFFYLGNRPKNYRVLEQELLKYYREHYN